MKKFLMGLLMASLLMVVAGCSDDPVKADLMEYQKVMASSMGKYKTDSAALQSKMQQAATNPEAMKAAYGDMAKLTENVQKDLANFKPKSEEMKKVADKMKGGYEGMTQAYKAAASGDMSKMAEVGTKLQDMAKANEDLVKLAKDKGLDLFK